MVLNDWLNRTESYLGEGIPEHWRLAEYNIEVPPADLEASRFLECDGGGEARFPCEKRHFPEHRVQAIRHGAGGRRRRRR